MTGSVLSAGQGKRLLPLTEDRPKCALMLGERTLLGWQLEALAAAGASEVVVATGFRAELIRQLIDGYDKLAVRTAHNPFYAHCDNLGTCWAVRHEMTDPFVIVNGDTLFEPAVFARLISSPDDHPLTLVTNKKSSYDDDDMKVIVAGNELKRVDKKLPAGAVHGESIGMIRFQGDGPRLFRERLESMMAVESALGRWYLSAIDALAAQGCVGVVTTGSHDWCEIDDRKDLEHARMRVPLWFERRLGARRKPASAIR